MIFIDRNKRRAPEIPNVDIRGKFDAKSLGFQQVIHSAFHALELEGNVNTMIKPMSFSIRIASNVRNTNKLHVVTHMLKHIYACMHRFDLNNL